MKKITYVLSMLCILSSSAFGTTLSHTFDVSYGFNKDSFLNGVSYKPMFGFFSNDRFKIGLGVRYSGFMAGNGLKYERVDSALDSSFLVLDRPQTHSFNTVFETTYTMWNKLEIGFNIDIVGYGYGKGRTANYQSLDGALAGAQASDAPNLDLFLFGKRDKGQLGSEFFLGYKFNPHLGVRAGLSHLITEHQSVQTLEGENRFRHLGNFIFASINYAL